VFKTEQPVIIYPASGTGAWEAALVNTLSPGDKVSDVRDGWFATLWSRMAKKARHRGEFIEGDWRSGVDAAAIEARLAEDRKHAIKAVAVVHNETSTGSPRRSPRCAAPSTAPDTRRCSRRHDLLARSIDYRTTSGASTSRSAARRRG
jgi:alanine-glyoxylate transaminase/serine-glyoxylate transaminase/serine-pyruvate transaminase